MRRSGLTLVELLVVLALLGLTAGLIVDSGSQMSYRNRVDETLRRGRVLTRVVLGDTLDGGRFIADMGRPPRLISNAAGEQLSELWEAATGSFALSNLSVTWPVGDTGMSPETSFDLWCGWRGPYLQIDETTWYDGWPDGGWSLLLEGEAGYADPDANGEMAAGLTGKTILAIRSLGSDRAVGGTEWHETDREFPSSGDFLSKTADLVVTFQIDDGGLRNIVATDFDRLRALLVVPEATDTVCQAGYLRLLWTDDPVDTTVEASSTEAVGGAERLSVAQVRFSGLMPGPRLIYAYGYLDADHDAAMDGGAPVLVNLEPGVNVITLRLDREI